MGLLSDAKREIAPLDARAMALAEERLASLTMPPGALGRICELAVRLSGVTGRMPPPTGRRAVVAMAGDHGVVAEGVSLHSAKITGQMVKNIAAGGAGVNVLARLNGAEVILADFGMAERVDELLSRGALLDCSVGRGTDNLARGPAMTAEQALRAVENGIALARRLSGRFDLLGTGEMGIGNSTPATAVAACLTGLPVGSLCGRGTGLDDAGVARKTAVVVGALERNRPDPDDGLDVLAKVGGFELGGIAGLILGGAALRVPVLVDGFISTAGAMLALRLCPAVRPYLILAHASAEPGHAAMCGWLGQKPLLDLGMRLGEGTGAAMAMNVAAASAAILSEMATFDDAGVEARIDV